MQAQSPKSSNNFEFLILFPSQKYSMSAIAPSRRRARPLGAKRGDKPREVECEMRDVEGQKAFVECDNKLDCLCDGTNNDYDFLK
jgi:hypothetical protein